MPFISNGIYPQESSSNVIAGNTYALSDKVIPISTEFKNIIGTRYQTYVYNDYGMHLSSENMMYWGCFNDSHVFMITINSDLGSVGRTLKWVDYDITKKTCTNKSCTLPASFNNRWFTQFAPIIGTTSIMLIIPSCLFKVDLLNATITKLITQSFTEYAHPFISSDGKNYYIGPTGTSDYSKSKLYKYNMDSNTLTTLNNNAVYNIIDIIDDKYQVCASYTNHSYGGSAELQLNIYGIDGNTPSGMTDSSLFSSMSRPGHGQNFNRIFAGSHGTIITGDYDRFNGPAYILGYDVSESLVCNMTHIAAFDHTYCISNPESELIGNTAYGCDISNVTTNENGSPLTMRVLPQFIGFDGISCMSALMATSFDGRYEGACTPSDLAVTRPYLMKLTIEEIKK